MYMYVYMYLSLTCHTCVSTTANLFTYGLGLGFLYFHVLRIYSNIASNVDCSRLLYERRCRKKEDCSLETALYSFYVE